MQSKLLLATTLGAALAPLASADNVVGLYVFHRHGDRTAKAWQPVSLTPLGADEVLSSGDFFRKRYVASDAGDLRISQLSSDRAVLSQLAVTAPVDNVLHNSAVVFLQGLGPLGGYQYIPVNAVVDAASSGNSEGSSWLQGGSGCSQAIVSSNNYLQSPDYAKTYADSKDFYQGLLPVINGTYNATQATFKNGYSIFDLINVAEIHNSSISSKDILTKPTLARLYDLASTHEWNLAFNASDPVRAISGSVLAGQILDSLQDVANGKASAPRFNIQFGAYGTFMSFFGLAQLPAASNDFYGICDYASSMVFELVAPTATGYKADDLSVRFYFSNGTAGEDGLKQFPLFGQDKTTLSWNDFKTSMNKFAIADTKHWCQVCGNTDGACASSTPSSGGSASTKSSSSRNSVTKPVAGVIGALVTLVVVLGIQAAVLLLGGLRLVKKSTLAGGTNTGAAGVKA
ncbi:hypothetical protein PT974_08815 [Cladobotryum mycophilum]|uniref:Acid phosphatase n=1 Tax=Cladobotryum mycophilum TaxID=491253 RepID=A0ABR0SFT7_9HYPO